MFFNNSSNEETAVKAFASLASSVRRLIELLERLEKMAMKEIANKKAGHSTTDD